MKTKIIAALLASLALSACGGDEAPETTAAPPRPHATDPAPEDAPAEPATGGSLVLTRAEGSRIKTGQDAEGGLVGTWLHETGKLKMQLTFGADGSVAETFSFAARTFTMRGRYTVSADVLDLVFDQIEGAVAANQRVHTAHQYYLGGARLVLGAMRPQGMHAGIVGTWSTRLTATGTSGRRVTRIDLQISATFRPDGTATMALHGTTNGIAADVSAEATWAPDGDRFALSLSDRGVTRTLGLQLLDGQVLAISSFTAAP